MTFPYLRYVIVGLALLTGCSFTWNFCWPWDPQGIAGCS